MFTSISTGLYGFQHTTLGAPTTKTLINWALLRLVLSPQSISQTCICECLISRLSIAGPTPVVAFGVFPVVYNIAQFLRLLPEHISVNAFVLRVNSNNDA